MGLGENERGGVEENVGLWSDFGYCLRLRENYGIEEISWGWKLFIWRYVNML